VAGAPTTGCAHSKQNFADAESGVPQLEHLNANGVAHSSQNFAWSGFSWRHCGQIMAGD
jgi:hypothetical protein